MKQLFIAAALVVACRSEAATRHSDAEKANPHAGLAAASSPVTSATAARDYITIVGSSTVYPFSTVVAEQFGRTGKFKTPKVESTGSGGGLKLFCSGVGATYPDIANSSRKIKPTEVAQCAKNGVAEIVELQIGYDGIVLASSKQSAPLDISLRQLWLALAKRVPDADAGATKPNPYQRWSEIDPGLPDQKIEVFGPPPTSGTRDAFVELAMEHGCSSFPSIKALAGTDEQSFKALCHTLREDGRFIEASENDNLIVQKLGANPSAFGVFGFSFLDQNAEKVRASRVDGVAPSFETIADRSYSLSRPLFIYVKKAHVPLVPGMAEYLAEFTSPRAWGPEGYLADKGMIPLSETERSRFKAVATNLTPLGVQM